MSSGDNWMSIEEHRRRTTEELDEYKRNLVNNIKVLTKETFRSEEEDCGFRVGILEGLYMVINLIDPNRIY